MADVDNAVRAFMQQRGVPMTAENMNRARQFLVEQQPAMLNSIMRDMDRRGRPDFTAGGRGSQFEEFVRQSDGEDQPASSQSSQSADGGDGGSNSPAAAPTPPQQPGQRPQQMRQSGAPQGTPPTPGMNPRQQQQDQQSVPQMSGGEQSAQGSQGGDTGDDSGIPGASGDSLTDEIIMSLAGARAASAPTRAPRGAQVNTQMGRPGSAPQGPQTSASQPQIENVQEAQQVNDNLPMQQGGQQQSQASQALPGAEQRAQMAGPDMQQPQMQGPQGRATTDTPVNDIVRKQQSARNAAQMTQAVNNGEMPMQNVADLLEFQQITQVDGPNGAERAAVYQNAEGDRYMISTSGQVYLDGQPLQGVQFTPERVTELFEMTFPSGLADASPQARMGRAGRAIGGAM